MAKAIYRNIPDSQGNNAYQQDPDFARLLSVYLPAELRDHLEPVFQELGALTGDELERLAREADRNPPTLRFRNRDGSDAQVVEKHPSYQRLEYYAFSRFGLAAMSHRGNVLGWPEVMPPLVKYGLTYLFVQAEFGLCCPLSMTDALTRTLRKFGDEDLINRFIDDLTSQDEDTLFQGAMFMTEQDAGSDVGAITTEARFEDGAWRLYGDKWFCSNADADLAMVLARPSGGDGGTRGLTLFLLPRRLSDGSLNRYRIIRLKDKLGTRSMASGEIVLEGAEAYVVGEPGNGFKQMTDMINMSRLSNGVRSAGMMRRSVNEALFIARNRVAFGRKLIDLPLLKRQLVKMMVTAEQGRSMVFHTAECLRRADQGDAVAAKLLRILTPLIKFRTTRDARKVAADGMEVRGGCGYIEEWSDARVLRDAHLGSIWEGTSNIVALDVFRAIRREQTLPVLSEHLQQLLSESALSDSERQRFEAVLKQVTAAADQVAGDTTLEADARRIASALYNFTSAVVLAWEAARIGDDLRRLALAKLVLSHKLLPRDPLKPEAGDGAWLAALLAETPLFRDQVDAVWDD
ncbi:Acyl-CoA dehydrogenase family protein [Alloalcanivorax dieselolei B5]|uniref:Acyl-CoA dehydrogenase family protein n=1 Tax=Alcanivorax dieselolei (strain DSM 16502 / CGMCC 1.3690 / MCCC 1A00001 / B-5) TaxID=930169 RepID=K0CJ81_ALCDB|nr:acyl-CoA dehydrogenase family protein [Alloalcanivorax dieselolei]AFT71621.1 Acyl-CoA dehydrogenase family protein [Alloalcanivorax dieselolei B5]GGJ89383.1 acyl-CoA dehydrogenase [Alloalcanivorax dieselolei]